MTETPAEGTETQPTQSTQPTENVSPASEVQAAPATDNVPAAGDAGDTFSEHPEVGEIIVDDKNRPFLVLDVNETDGSVIGLAFNLDGSSEVVTERADHGE